jgi:hypothetical protein
MVFHIVAPPDPRELWCEQFWIYIIPESFHINMTYSDSVVLEKKIFKWPHLFLHFCNYLPLEEDLAIYLNNLESSLLLTQESFTPNLIEIGVLALDKILKKNSV